MIPVNINLTSPEIAVDLAIREMVRVSLVRPDPNLFSARGIFYPEKYGALHGGADDTEAIQTALTKAEEYGGIVWCYGDYTSRKLQIGSNVILYLASRGTRIKLKDGADEELIVNSDPGVGNTGIEIYGGILDGNKANQGEAYATVKLTGCSDSFLERCIIKNGSYSNLTLLQCTGLFLADIISKNPASVGALLNGSNDCHIDGFKHTTDVGGIIGYHGVLLYNGSEDNILNRIHVRSIGNIIGVCFHTGCHRNKLSHGVFIGCGNGIEIVGSDYFQVDDVYAQNDGLTSDYESGIEIVNSSKGTLSNAILRNNYAAGLYVRSASNDNIFEEIIAEMNGWSGFLVDASLRNKFAASKAIKNDGRGYYFTAASHDNGLTGSDALNNGQGGAYAGIEIHDTNYTKVTGGVFSDDQTPKTQTYAVEETGTSNYSQIHGINASRNLTGTIVLLGASSVETDNMV